MTYLFWPCHVIKLAGKAVMLGILDVKRKRGSQNAQWPDIIKADNSQSIKLMKQAIQDWEMWREHNCHNNCFYHDFY